MPDRSIIIGDIHGCYEELRDLLSKISYTPDRDRLIFVGDLINKGPHSRKVIEYARKQNVECVLGNHELRFIEYVRNNETNRPKWDAIKKEFGDTLEDNISWLENLPMFIEDEEFMVVHAGIVAHKAPEKTTPHILANIRTWDGIGVDLNHPSNPAWYDLYDKKKLIIYGHWAVEGLNIRENTIGLDTGCVYGKTLTALILPGRKIEQVQARKTYCKIT